MGSSLLEIGDMYTKTEHMCSRFTYQHLTIVCSSPSKFLVFPFFLSIMCCGQCNGLSTWRLSVVCANFCTYYSRELMIQHQCDVGPLLIMLPAMGYICPTSQKLSNIRFHKSSYLLDFTLITN